MTNSIAHGRPVMTRRQSVPIVLLALSALSDLAASR
jgi:hypothetical protein